MRAISHARPRPGGALLLALATCALLPATAAAKPAVRIKAVDVPSATVESGSTFTLDTRLKNRSNKAVRPRVSVQLRAEQGGDWRRIASRRVAKLKAGRTATVDLKARVPKQVDPGTYDIKVCAPVARHQGLRHGGHLADRRAARSRRSRRAGRPRRTCRPRRTGRTARPSGSTRSSRRSGT